MKELLKEASSEGYRDIFDKSGNRSLSIDMTTDLDNLTEQNTKNVPSDELTGAMERLLKDINPEQRLKVLRVGDVSNQLGHHSPKLTWDIYYHWLPGKKKAEVDALDDVEYQKKDKKAENE